MTLRLSHRAAVLACAVALGLSGCGGDGDTNDTAAPSPTTAATTAAPVVPVEGATPLPASLQGSYEDRKNGQVLQALEMTATTFFVHANAEPPVRGEVRVKGDTLVFFAQASCGDGYDVLRFTFVGGKLTFTDVVHGDCDAMPTNVHTTLVKIS